VTVRAGSIHLRTDGAATEGWHTAIAQPEGDIEDDIDVRHVAASVPLATRRL
jgi:hypothetical protein